MKPKPQKVHTSQKPANVSVCTVYLWFLTSFLYRTVEPKIDDSLLPSEINAEIGKPFKVVIPFKGGPVTKALFTKVANKSLSDFSI